MQKSQTILTTTQTEKYGAKEFVKLISFDLQKIKYMRIVINLIIIISLINLSNYVVAKPVANSEIADSLKKIDLLNDVTFKIIKKDREKAMAFAQKALELSQNKDYQKGIATAANNIGIILRDNGDYKKAIAFFQQSLDIFNNIEMTPNIADVCDNIGGSYYYQGNLNLALDYYFRALKIREQNHDGQGMASSYINLGLIYKEQENYEKALHYLFKGLNIVKELNNLDFQAIAYNNIGLCYKNTKRYDKAQDYYLKSLQIKKQLGDKNGIALCYNNLGSLYEIKGNYNKALAYHFSSLKIKEELGNKRGLALSNASIGFCYYKKGNPEKALTYLDKAYEVGNEIGAVYIIMKASEVLKSIYYERNNYQLAYDYLNVYKNMSDSLLNSQNTQKSTRMMLEYEFDKKQRIQKIEQLKNELNYKADINREVLIRNIAIIVLLFFVVLAFVIYRSYLSTRKANKLLKAQKEQILAQRDHIQKQKNNYQKLNQTKDKFFSIVAHDLKNPFHTLIGFSELLISNYDTYGDEEKLKYLRIINDSSKNTHSLLENLLNWARTQTDNIQYYPEKILVTEIINENLRFLKLNAEKKNIVLKSMVKEESLLFIDKNMINTVIRNLLGNALKFTDSGGKVIIYTNDLGQFTEICIQDTGIGIKKDDIEKLFKIDEYHSTNGTLEEKGTGLGLIICKEFVEKNGGAIRVESQANKGSTFIFTVPKASISKTA